MNISAKLHHQPSSRIYRANSHAAHTPHVDARTVCPRSQENIGCSVPQCDDLCISESLLDLDVAAYLVTEGVDGNTERSSQTEITNLQFASSIDE